MLLVSWVTPSISLKWNITYDHKPFSGNFTLIKGLSLHGGGGPQVGEATCLGGVKQITLVYMQSYAMLQPRHPGVYFLKIIEWLLRS